MRHFAPARWSWPRFAISFAGLSKARTFPMTHLSGGYLLANRIEDATWLTGQALDFVHDHKLRAYEAWALRPDAQASSTI
jgi:hypothetical protein